MRATLAQRTTAATSPHRCVHNAATNALVLIVMYAIAAYAVDGTLPATKSIVVFGVLFAAFTAWAQMARLDFSTALVNGAAVAIMMKLVGGMDPVKQNAT